MIPQSVGLAESVAIAVELLNAKRGNAMYIHQLQRGFKIAAVVAKTKVEATEGSRFADSFNRQGNVGLKTNANSVTVLLLTLTVHL